jgi:hypothetical protein
MFAPMNKDPGIYVDHMLEAIANIAAPRNAGK